MFTTYKRKMLAVLSMVAGLLFFGAGSALAAPVDPLGGAGQGLVDDLLANFITFVIPAVVAVILAVYAWKLIVKLGTRFLNRA